jgi:hypothetical protein
MAESHSSDNQQGEERHSPRREKARQYRNRKKAQDANWAKIEYQKRKQRDPGIHKKKYQRALARDPNYNRKKYIRRRELQIQRGECIAPDKEHLAKKDLTEEQRRKKKIQRIIERQRERYEIDPAYAMHMRVRSRMKYALKACMAKKSTRSLWLVGCSSHELAAHIESLFKPGMSWANRREWHVDHIIPVSAFNLATEEEQRAAFHYTNLQPMWAKDNHRKGAKVPGTQRRFTFGYVLLADEQRSGRRREARRRKGDVPNLQPPGPDQ